MKTHKWADVRRSSGPDSEARTTQIKNQMLAEIGLHELRRRRALSQSVLADELGITQSAVSQLERSPDPQLSTLRAYIQGLGGTLHITAVFDDEDVAYDLTVGSGR